MNNQRIAVSISSLRMGPYEAMKLVADWGVGAVHLNGSGPFAPENLDDAGRRGLHEYVRSLGLEISAIVAWGGDVDLCEREGREENTQRAKQLLQLAADLECGIWAGHMGIMPPDAAGPRWDNIVSAMQQIAAYGEEVGACLAIETGPEPPAVVKQLIETVGSPAIRVNYDPANLILWPPMLAARSGEEYHSDQALAEFQPTEGVQVLGPYIVHTHAKDALVHPDGQGEEVPLGQGWVDWPRYVAYLQEAGYDGYFAIEREVGDDPVGDVKQAVEFLRGL